MRLRPRSHGNSYTIVSQARETNASLIPIKTMRDLLEVIENINTVVFAMMLDVDSASRNSNMRVHIFWRVAWWSAVYDKKT